MEFALATPLLMVILGGAADFGIAQYNRIMLANAVAAGAEYASLTTNGNAPSSVGTLQTNITNVVQMVSGLPNAAATVTVSFSSVSPGVTSPGWYCVTGTAPTITASTSGGTCTDGSQAGYYISFQASYTMTGLLHGFMSAANRTMSEQTTLKLQ